MTSFHFSIDPRSRKAGRFIRAVRQEIQKALVEEKGERKLTQADLARELGVDRSVVNRQLTGEANLTLRSVADYAWVLGREIEFSLTKPKAAQGSNSAPEVPPKVEAANYKMEPINPRNESSSVHSKGVSSGFLIRGKS